MENYSTAAVAKNIGISKNTLLRWIAEGRVPDAKRDWRGWRVWSEEEISRIRRFNERSLQTISVSDGAWREIRASAAESMARYGRALVGSAKGDA